MVWLSPFLELAYRFIYGCDLGSSEFFEAE